MDFLKKSVWEWPILALLVALSVGISFAANGGVTVQNNTSSNVGTKLVWEKTDTAILKDASGKIVFTYPHPAAKTNAN